jgi:hypothetical protein
MSATLPTVQSRFDAPRYCFGAPWKPHPINGGHQPEQVGTNRNRKSNAFPPGEHWKDSGDFSSYCFIYKARRLSHRLDTNLSLHSIANAFYLTKQSRSHRFEYCLGYRLFRKKKKHGNNAHCTGTFPIFTLSRQ